MGKTNRRDILKYSIGLGLSAALGLSGTFAQAKDATQYSPERLKVLQDAGTPFLIDFYTDWCSTCARQERVIAELQAGNPAYSAIPILRVDWDVHARSDFARGLKIPRRSTLVTMKGTTELGRVVAEVSSTAISGLLDTALLKNAP